MNWFVLYTKSRAEMKVAYRLGQLGIEVYCPVINEIRQRSDRKKNIQVPLLPSMVLVKISDKEKNRVFDVPGVIRDLFWLGRPAQVTDEEVLVLKKIMEGRNFLEHQVIQHQIVAQVDLLKLFQQGDIIKYSGRHYWVALKGLNIVVKLRAA